MRYFALGLAALAFASGASAQQTQQPSATSVAVNPQAPPAAAPISPEQERTVDRLRAAALESNLAWEIVEDLVTEIGPRLAGSEAEARARDWAVNMLREQRFSNVRIEPFTIPYWDATREEASIVGPAPQPMVIAALGGSPSTPQGGLEAEVVRFADMAALEAAPEDAVRGRIVFIDERMQRTQDGSGYGAAVAKRGRCAPVAQAKGAVACLIRSVGTDPHRFAHQGGSSRQSQGASLPAAAISPADADLLARRISRGATRVRLDIQADIRENAPSGNVIAEIRGRERPDEIVLLAAHLDSWDMGQGAVDDGAGVAIVTAAAKLIRDLPRRPRRTIRILLAGAEENGVHGGAAYAEAHANETHIVGAESDFGAGPIWRFRTRFADHALPYGRAIQRQLAPLGIIPGDNAAGGGADIGAMRQAGMPVVDLSQNGLDYFDYHHTPNDTLDKIDPEALRQNVAAYAVFAYLVADSDGVFTAEP
ncbi:MAG TPA: M20/M25/M40 family metallo-hydrolase [Vitreimonas sp.]|uniref:M20/M25/M40 family metallo-hydrolase n=1 Tax=Vitreimonas sp. TaxID=3069702 RepID=UPI002D5DCA99|nr:M20/M25/M40 family metallo-hydrolase [Vitreimonas sp.]HYD89651.1 M20/M25/M40 family metallo-hydrolase [Vitreimonas sp.]